MSLRILIYMCLIAIPATWPGLAQAQSCDCERVLITGGSFQPLYAADSQQVPVDSFMMDVTPVTNAQFLAFVKANPKWLRSRVKTIFAEENYLAHWAGDTTLGPGAPPESPVINVSWFASKAYCNWCKGRLPDTYEWEFVARASKEKQDALDDQAFKDDIIRKYEKQLPEPLPAVAQGESNFWGLYDIHGLVWEWTADFHSVLFSGESRKDASIDRNIFCAGGSIGSIDPANYAAFIRYALRGSLKANYCLKNLGFRCIANVPAE